MEWFIIFATLFGILDHVYGNEVVLSKIERVSLARGEDPILIQAIAKVESSLNKDAIGEVGELGLFQIRPEYHDISLDMTVEEQAEAAIDLLQKLKVSCKEKFLQCWNMGITKTKQKNFKVTKYERKVADEYKNLQYKRSFPSIKSKAYTWENFK